MPERTGVCPLPTVDGSATKHVAEAQLHRRSCDVALENTKTHQPQRTQESTKLLPL
jgi:hypothetical protein